MREKNRTGADAAVRAFEKSDISQILITIGGMLIYAIVLIVVMIFNQSPEMIALRKRLTARFRKEDAEGKGAKDKEKKGVA